MVVGQLVNPSACMIERRGRRGRTRAADAPTSRPEPVAVGRHEDRFAVGLRAVVRTGPITWNTDRCTDNCVQQRLELVAAPLRSVGSHLQMRPHELAVRCLVARFASGWQLVERDHRAARVAIGKHCKRRCSRAVIANDDCRHCSVRGSLDGSLPAAIDRHQIVEHTDYSGHAIKRSDAGIGACSGYRRRQRLEPPDPVLQLLRGASLMLVGM